VSVGKATLSYLGRYRLLKVINTSQTTQLWQAYDDGNQRFVGIKTILEKARRDREPVSHLKREFAVGSKIVHDRVIRVYEYGTDRGVPYMAMEWFPSVSMKKRIGLGGDALVAMIPKIALQAAEGLAHFSSLGWVHRDVKPENFLVAEGGDVKLIDFGLAIRAKGFLAKLFATKSKIQGTRSYMSPEQIRGEALDERADVYSLGCTLFELVAGRPPFTGTSSKELLTKHLSSAPPPLESISPAATSEFAQLIRRSMAKRPDERPEGVVEFYNELRVTPVFRRMAEKRAGG
jgi:eukaryotic-like serine/threonine-protein kinase